jgi:hypothetical protein
MLSAVPYYLLSSIKDNILKHLLGYFFLQKLAN